MEIVVTILKLSNEFKKNYYSDNELSPGKYTQRKAIHIITTCAKLFIITAEDRNCLTKREQVKDIKSATLLKFIEFIYTRKEIRILLS